MLRVAVVLSHPFHASLGTDFRILNQIVPMAKLQTEIHFVSLFGDAPLPKLDNLSFRCYSKSPWISHTAYGLSRRALNHPSMAPLVMRLPNLFQITSSVYAKRLTSELRRVDPDVVLAIHQVAAAACRKVKVSLGCPVIADIHSVWAEELVAAGILRRDSPAFSEVLRFDKYSLESVDYSVVVSEELKLYLGAEFGIPSDRIVVVGPCMEPRVAEAKRVSNPSRIVFCGMANYRERFDLILKSMPHVLDRFPQARLYATRKGDNLDEMQRLAHRLGIAPRYFYYESPNEFYDFLNTCHVGLVASSNDVARRLAYPAKIWDYMSVGLPIVANDVGGWSRFIRESEAGILTDDSPQGLANGVVSLLENPDQVYEMGQNGLDYIRRVMKPENLVRQFRDTLQHAAREC